MGYTPGLIKPGNKNRTKDYLVCCQGYSIVGTSVKFQQIRKLRFLRGEICLVNGRNLQKTLMKNQPLYFISKTKRESSLTHVTPVFLRKPQKDSSYFHHRSTCGLPIALLLKKQPCKQPIVNQTTGHLSHGRSILATLLINRNRFFKLFLANVSQQNTKQIQHQKRRHC